MAQTTQGSSASRISEAFSFLKEYQLGTAFDEAKAERNCCGNHNGLVNGEKEEFTIVTYVDNKVSPKKSFSKTKNYSEKSNDSKSVLENGANKLNDHGTIAGVNPECDVSLARESNKDSTESEEKKLHDEVNSERSGAEQRSVCSSENINHCLRTENSSDDEKVVMRKNGNMDMNNFVHKTSETKCSDSAGILSAPSNSSSVHREEAKGSRGSREVVSDAFDFLKDMEDGQHPDYRESFIVETGGEDKIFNKLSVVSETLENSNSLNVNSIVSNGSIKDGQHNPESPTDQQSKACLRRQRNVSTNSLDNSEDSSDDDTGIYNESYRKSVWLCMPDEKSPRLFQPSSSIAEEQESDEVFLRSNDALGFDKPNKRSDSTTTTNSESEFKHEYRIRRKCRVHRHDSQQEYHRLSAKLYEQEKVVVIIKEDHDKDFGLHIYDSHPAFITEVDMGSPAHRAGVKPGQILVCINGVNVLESSHEEIIKMVQKDPSMVKLEVAAGDIHYVRNSQTPVMSGYMYKQSNSTFVKNWRRRYFVLRNDNCLYYYKGEQDLDPLGAFPLLNYIVLKHTDSSKEHCFKAEKFGARTYYFIPDTREEMINWISALNKAATRAREKKDAWMDVTAHNVGLPALDIKKPDCSGYLSKCGRAVKRWRKRYCVLKDACIYYYKNINSASAQGMAHLHGYSVDQVSGSPRKHIFILRPPEPQMRTFSFCAENETDKNRWMVAMEKSIQRWVKVD